jgi:integrase
MTKVKLTDGLVKDLTATGRDVYVWDSELKRFGLRVTPSGTRLFVVRYRTTAGGLGSKSRRLTIGEFDGKVWNVTKARAQAAKLLAGVDLDADPFAARKAKRAELHQAKLDAQEAEAASAREAKRRALETVEAQLELYITRRLAKRRSGGEAARLLRHGPVATWGPRHVSEIRRADVADLLESIAQRSPAVARATFAELRPFFDWCVERDKIAVSPCANVKAPPRPEARDRVLADDELRLIWRAADAIGFPFGPAFKLMILTGQRRAEVAGMTWAELDLTAARWRIPAERAKNKQAHELDLSPEALAIIEALPKAGAYLFPARGEGAIRGFSAVKRKLDAKVEALRREDATKAGEDPPTEDLPDWRIHDFRRTAATGMAALNFAPHIVERVLNHVSGTQSGLVGVYQRHEYRPERKAAITGWGARVSAILSDAPIPSNVIRLDTSRA